MKFLARLLLTSGALILTASIVPGIEVVGLYSTLLAALLLGIVNALIRPILIILTLPITILTLGLFIFVINATLFLFVASIVDGFHVSGFLSALLGSVIMSCFSSLIHKFL